MSEKQRRKGVLSIGSQAGEWLYIGTTVNRLANQLIAFHSMLV